MAKGQSVLQVLEAPEDQRISTCTTCPTLCRWSCPVADTEARETTSPQRLTVLSGLLKKGRISAQSAGSLPYHCSDCGACTEACLHGVDVASTLHLARSRVLGVGAAPRVVREVVGHFAVSGNPQGTSLEPALDAALDGTGVVKRRAADLMYFPGCQTLEQMPEAASGFLRAAVLGGRSDVGVRPASAACCGLPLLWAGELEGFRGHAARFAAQLSDVRTLVVHDGACARALTTRYPEVGVHLGPKVVTAVDFLAEALRADEAQPDGKGPPESRIAFADTCHLARGFDALSAPRQLIAKRFRKVAVELDEDRGRAVDCCGASGLLPIAAPDTAAAMAERRLEAFRATDAAQLVMASPRCAAHLKAADPSAPVVDLATLLGTL